MTDTGPTRGDEAAALAASMAQWLAGFPVDAWPSLLAMQTQTITALATVERNKRRKRKAGA